MRRKAQLVVKAQFVGSHALGPEERAEIEAIERVLSIYRWNPFALLQANHRRGLAIQCFAAARFAKRNAKPGHRSDPD